MFQRRFIVSVYVRLHCNKSFFIQIKYQAIENQLYWYIFVRCPAITDLWDSYNVVYANMTDIYLILHLFKYKLFLKIAFAVSNQLDIKRHRFEFFVNQFSICDTTYWIKFKMLFKLILLLFATSFVVSLVLSKKHNIRFSQK